MRLIRFPVGDHVAGNARLDSSLSHRRRDFDKETLIHGLRDEVLPSEGKPFGLVGFIDIVRDRALR